MVGIYILLSVILLFQIINFFKTKKMAKDITELKAEVVALNTKADDLQTALDAEQQQLADLLALNAQVVTDLTAERDRLQAIIDAGGVITPEDLAEISTGITTATGKLATSQADLEGTVTP